MRKILVFATVILLMAVVAYATAKVSISISPNPFEEQTTIQFYLPDAATISLAIENDKEEVLAVIFSGACSAGSHSYMWDGTGEDGERLAPGRYWVHLQEARFTSVKRVIILK